MERAISINEQEKFISNYEKEISELKKWNQILEEEKQTVECKLNIAKEHARYLERIHKPKGNYLQEVNQRQVKEIEQLKHRNRQLESSLQEARQFNDNRYLGSQEGYYQDALQKKDYELSRLREINQDQAGEIRDLKCQIVNMEYAYNQSEEKSNKYKAEVKEMDDDLTAAYIRECECRDKIEIQREKIEQLQLKNQQYDENVVNFPTDLVDHFSKVKGTPDAESSQEDEMFHKELAKRIACKICLSDVEHLRCPECLNGICRGCHSKVKACPRCRHEKKTFQPIIMSRL